MKKKALWLGVAALLWVSLDAQDNGRREGVAAPDSLFYHTVEGGQTVYAISRMYGVGEEDIYRLNPGSRLVIRTGERLLIPQKSVAAVVTAGEDEQGYVFHTIEAKETLYSLSLRYNVPARAITDANPGLSVSTFIIGRTIRIPTVRVGSESLRTTPVVKEMEYKVERRETLYSISRKFNVPLERLVALNPGLKNGVKEGMVIKVPVKTEEMAQQRSAEEKAANALLQRQVQEEKMDTIRVALLLPFMADRVEESAQRARFVEYYEGLLLAIDSLRNKGICVRLTVRDTGHGADKLNAILKESALKEARLIIGALENEQIDRVAGFAKQTGAKYVIPFTSKNDHVLSHAFIFQVNTPQSYLCDKAAQAAYHLFKRHNIIFIDTRDENNKTDFIHALEQEFAQHDISYRTLTYNDSTFTEDMEGMLSLGQPNAIIPLSGSAEALNKIRTPLHTLVGSHPEYTLNLFGYPEWQTYKESLDDLFALDTYIYSNFFVDNLSPDLTRFATKYKLWFSKSLSATYPKYGLLGYDTGMFFIEAFRRYGERFDMRLNDLQSPSLQSGFRFQRVNNWGGFINTHLFIVHYDKSDYRIVRRNAITL